MASECQKSDLNFLYHFLGEGGPQSPQRRLSLSVPFLNPPSLNSGIHPIEYNKQLHLVSTDQVQSATARPYLIQLPHLAPFPTNLPRHYFVHVQIL